MFLLHLSGVWRWTEGCINRVLIALWCHYANRDLCQLFFFFKRVIILLLKLSFGWNKFFHINFRSFSFLPTNDPHPHHTQRKSMAISLTGRQLVREGDFHVACLPDNHPPDMPRAQGSASVIFPHVAQSVMSLRGACEGGARGNVPVGIWGDQGREAKLEILWKREAETHLHWKSGFWFPGLVGI